MSTTEKKAATVQGIAANPAPTSNRAENRPSLTGKEAKDAEKANAQLPPGGPNAEAGKMPDAEFNKSAAAEAKSKEVPKTPALNLEQVLRSVEGLHRLTVQRLALIARIKTLEDFEVKLIEDNDELESNPYQGCKLIIKDDRGREFITNTPNLIRMVSQFIFDACHDKLAEIEANIIFPVA